ncbi:MAG: BF3164 family lipoprotein [Bacteroidetes bacterium]|nr:BF3164 family lipoprotein [Bacteroidota bacterium]
MDNLVRGPDFFVLKYDLAILGESQSPAMMPDPDMRFGYIGVVSTDRYIYALYSGRTIPEVSHYASYGRQVIVFEWSGYPVAIFDLGGDYASDIAISPDDQELFAIYDSPVPIIVRYNLPQLSVDR